MQLLKSSKQLVSKWSVLTLIFVFVSISLIYSFYSAQAYDSDMTLYVDSYTDPGGRAEWTTFDAPSPYLSDSNDNWIYEDKTSSMEAGNFGFANNQVDESTNTIDNVYIHFECQNDDGNDGFAVFIDSGDGSGFVSLGNVICTSIGSYAWETIDASGRIDSWVEVNDTTMYLDTVSSGPGDDMYVRRAYINVTYSTSAGNPPYNVSLNNPVNESIETSTTINFNCSAKDTTGLNNATLYFNTTSGSGDIGWTAYNDVAGSGSGGNITYYEAFGSNAGYLINYSDNTQLAAYITLTGGAASQGGTSGQLYPGTDAYNIFSGVLDVTDNIWYYLQGTDQSIVFTGLDSSKKYRFVHFADRGINSADYTIRWANVSISDADAYTQNSSVSIEQGTYFATYCSGYNVNGFVAAWTDIESGADGDFTITITSNHTNEKGSYTSALMIQELPGTGSEEQWTANETKSLTGTDNSTIFTKVLNDGEAYKWNCHVCDTSVGCNWSTLNSTFSIDTSIGADNYPSVTLISPEQNEYITSPLFKDYVQVDFNCSMTDDFNLTNVTLYWNQTGAGYEESITRSISVSASTDDAEEYEAGTMDASSLTSTDLELCNDTAAPRGRQKVGMRFLNIQIPQGSVIINASIKFMSDNGDSDTGGTPNLLIFGQDADSSPTFVASNNNISNRPRTSNTTSWSPGVWDYGTRNPYWTPSLKDIIQEIVDRSGWQSGNNIVIIINASNDNFRRAESWDGASGDSPYLQINYTHVYSESENWTSNGTMDITGNTSTSVIFSRNITDNRSYKYNCYVCDNSSQCAFGDSNISFNIDSGYTPSEIGMKYLFTPYIMWHNDTIMIMRYKASKKTNYTLEYGLTQSYGTNITESTTSLSHEFNITGLAAGTNYYYRLTIRNNTNGQEYYNNSYAYDFLTPDSTRRKFAFAVFGDGRGVGCGQIEPEYNKVIGSVYSNHSWDFALTLGDNVQMNPCLADNETTERVWQGFHNITSLLFRNRSVFGVWANHEVLNTDNQMGIDQYEDYWIHPKNETLHQLMDEKVYVTEYGNTQIIALNTENSSGNITDEQYTWLKNVLENPSKLYQHRIVFGHHPLFGSVNRPKTLSTDDPTWSEHISGLMYDNNVTITFWGHNHLLCINHTENGNFPHITAGIGGAGLHTTDYCEGTLVTGSYGYLICEIDEYEIMCKAYNESGNEISGTTVIRNMTDSTSPDIEFSSVNEANNTEVYQNFIYVEAIISEKDYENATFYLFNNSGLVSNMTTFQRQAFILGEYELNESKNLALGPDTSDIAYNPNTDTLFVVHNTAAGESIDELWLNGTSKRNIDLSTNFEDTEGIAYMRTYADGNHSFAIVEERQANMTIINITDTTTSLNINDWPTYNITGGAAGIGNDGLEGVTYDSENELFYIVKEWLNENPATGMAVFRVNITDYTAPDCDVTELFNADDKLGPYANDLSGVYYDIYTELLYISSHLSNKIMKVNLTGDVLEQLSIPYFGQLEGVTFHPYGDKMWITGEPDNLSTYITSNWTVSYNFTGLLQTESGIQYYYNISSIDQSDNYGTSETRWIKLLERVCNEEIMYIYPPYIAFLNDTTMQIRFKVDRPINYTIEYGLTQSYGTEYYNLTSNDIHEIHLNELTEGETYYYKLNLYNSSDTDCYINETWKSSFKMPNSSATSFSFAIIGDGRAGTCLDGVSDTYGKLLDDMYDNHSFDLLIETGDIIYGNDCGSLANFEYSYFDFYNESQQIWKNISLFSTVGNHEEPSEANARTSFRNLFMQPRNTTASGVQWDEIIYTFEYANSQFISINTEIDGGNISGDHYTWLKDILENPPKLYQHRFIFGHRPLFGSTGRAGTLSTDDPTWSQHLSQLFYDNNVSVTFWGHNHQYCLNTTQDGEFPHMITGGGGAAFSNYCIGTNYQMNHWIYCNITDNVINCTAYNWTGELSGTNFSRTMTDISAPSGDTCDCSSIQAGTTIDCSENCDISACDANTQDILISGTGHITISGDITNFGNLKIQGTDSSNICIVTCTTGCFKD